jgi:bifunctional pyridoxal-dependent enzyme with beta-cystathionase and maltose regulon repressor activities
LSYACSRATLEKAVERMRKALTASPAQGAAVRA